MRVCVCFAEAQKSVGRLHAIPPLFSKVAEFTRKTLRDLAEHFGVWLKRGARKECNRSAFSHGSGALSAF